MFREFFKTTIGMKSRCDGTKTAAAEKTADSVQGYDNPAAKSIMNAFGGGNKAPEPPPPPADVSTGSLSSRISAGVKSLMGGGG